jgi:hypothetical protein
MSNGEQIINDGYGKLQTYHYSNLFWNISYGMFDKKGRNPKHDIDPISITTEDLAHSEFYNTAVSKLQDRDMHSIGCKFTESVMKEVNGTFHNIIGKRSVVDEVSIHFKAVCPAHKEKEAAYCLCGVNEEKKESLDIGTDKNGQAGQGSDANKIDSVYCNTCCTWYHRECVDFRQTKSRRSKHAKATDFYSCPKCRAL